MNILAFEEDREGLVTKIQADNGKWFPMPDGVKVTQAEAILLPMKRQNGALVVGGSVKTSRPPKPQPQPDPPSVFEGTFEP